MNIHPLTPSRAAEVATLMSTLKPEWWDFEGANQQLQDVQLLATLVGWYLESDGKPKGWILCAEFPGYSTMTIENLGFGEPGTPRRNAIRRPCSGNFYQFCPVKSCMPR